MVVRGGKDLHITGGSKGSGVGGGLVSNSSRRTSDGSLGDIVTSLTTNNEALISAYGIDDGGEIARGATVEEGAGVEGGLFEMEVDFLALVPGLGGEEVLHLGLQAFRDGVVKLDLGIEQLLGRPSLGDSDAWLCIGQQRMHTGERSSVDSFRKKDKSCRNMFCPRAMERYGDTVEIEIYTLRLYGVFSFNLRKCCGSEMSHRSQLTGWATHRARGRGVMGVLSLHSYGDAIGGF